MRHGRVSRGACRKSRAIHHMRPCPAYGILPAVGCRTAPRRRATLRAACVRASPRRPRIAPGSARLGPCLALRGIARGDAGPPSRRIHAIGVVRARRRTQWSSWTAASAPTAHAGFAWWTLRSSRASPASSSSPHPHGQREGERRDHRRRGELALTGSSSATTRLRIGSGIG